MRVAGCAAKGSRRPDGVVVEMALSHLEWRPWVVYRKDCEKLGETVQ